MSGLDDANEEWTPTIVTNSSTEDRGLVDATLAGDADAFRVLVERDSAPVIRVCSRILGDATEAQDVAQEAFVRAYQALATFRGDGAFRSWVTRIAARQAVARLATRPDVLRLDGRDGTEGWAATLKSKDDLEQGTLDEEWRQTIRAAVAALPIQQREVVALRFFRDLSLEEIAEITRSPIGTVKSRLHRGLAALRDRVTSRLAE